MFWIDTCIFRRFCWKRSNLWDDTSSEEKQKRKALKYLGK